MAKRFQKADIKRNKDGGYRREGLRLLLSGKSLVWWVHEWVLLVTGEREHCRQTTGFGELDYDRAQLRRTEIVKDFREGKERGPKCPTFAGWVKTYRDIYEKRGKKGKPLATSTVVMHTSRLLHLLPFFGPMPLDHITHLTCLAYYDTRLKDGASVNTVIGECQFMQALMEVALVKTDFIGKNPWKKTGLRLVIGKKKTARSVSLDEEDSVLSVLTSEMQRFYTMMLWTGFRVGAMLKLPMELLWIPDASVEGGRIPGLRVCSKGKEYPQPLSPEAYAAYVAQEAHVRATKPNEKRLFPFSEAAARCRMKKGRKETGVAHFTNHDVRRTLVTRMKAGGTATKELSDLLHHSDDGKLVNEHYLTDNVAETADFKANYAALLRGAAAIRGDAG